MSHGFYRVGFVVTLVCCAFLAGLQAGGAGKALAEGGETVTVGGRGGGSATADSDGNMIAVTGTSPTGSAVLYLVDTKLKRVAIYHSNGKNIELVAARNIEFDLKIDAYKDESDEPVQVKRLRADWLKAHGGTPGEGAGGGPDGKGSGGKGSGK